jgi:pimeloyl-ACP methyl ester carboxylesterase
VPFARSQGLSIHYAVEGEGPPLVLQHGFSGTLQRWYWAGYVEALKSRYRLILPDARGHGRSDKPHDPAAYTLEAQAADVAAVMDHAGVEKAHYWGFSMGGRIGFALARDFPGRIERLVIGGAHPYARVLPESDRVDGRDPDLFVRRLYGRTGAALDALPPEVRNELFANDFIALAAGMGDWPSLEDVLPKMRMPCLLYVGDRDPYLEKMVRVAASIPDARFFVLPGLDHGTGFRESAQVLPRVTAFLEGRES